MVVALTSVSAGAAEGDPPHLMVVGDSISASGRYNADGTASHAKAWWAHVAEALGIPAADVAVSAQDGSGMLNAGHKAGRETDELDLTGTKCNGKTFGARLGEIRSQRPDILLVAGGRNDFNKCVDAKTVRATHEESEAAIAGYLSSLRDVTDAIGLDPSAVYVMSPWGTKFGTYRTDILPMVEHYADLNGFSWVEVPPTLPQAKDTLDGTHPNAKGTRKIASQVLAGSDLRRRFGSGADSGSGASYVCGGFAACKRAGHTSAGFSSAWRRSFWGLSAKDPANYAAFRMTSHDRSVAYPLGTAAPATWKDAAKAAGVRVRATPQVGDIAWWPASHWNGAASAKGQVAYVERVSADGTAIVASEGHSSSQFRWVRYTGRSFPSVFLRYRRADGTPTGSVTTAESPRAGTVMVSGVATDPDAYEKGVRIKLRLRQGDRTYTSALSKASTFGYTVTFHAAGLQPGAAVVRVYAYNAPHSKGSTHAVIGSRRVTIR